MKNSPTEKQREYHARWKAKNPERAKSVERRQFSTYYTTSKGRADHMRNNARARAKKKGIPFNIERDWIQERLERGICEATGIPFVMQMNGGRGHRQNSFSPSLDRIDQNGPYSPENCRIVVWIYNRARGAFPDGDFDLMIESLKKN